MLRAFDCNDPIRLSLLDLVLERSINFPSKFDMLLWDELVSKTLWLVTFSTAA
jgi:hypothetical protein